MKKSFWIIPLFGLLSACGTAPVEREKTTASADVAPAVPVSTPYKVVKLTAIGYGNMGAYDGYTPGQRRLMAMRAAKLDAYRALAEQVHGVRVTGNSTVAAMVSQNDSFRVHVDAYVRGARVASVTPMAEENYETILELELGSEFFEYFNRRPAPLGQAVLRSPAATLTGPEGGGDTTLGRVGPGSVYSANFFYYSE
jgi:hypothetical protein